MKFEKKQWFIYKYSDHVAQDGLRVLFDGSAIY
jgi:polyphosphate kinase 2 (PPK2 family)